MCFNAHHEPLEFTLPPKEFGTAWRVVVCTAPGDSAPDEGLSAAGKLIVDAHTAAVLQAVQDTAAG